MKKISIIIAFIALVSACQKEPEKLQFSTARIEKSYQDCDPDGKDCSFISLTYPKAEGDPSKAKIINDSIENLLFATVNYQEDVKTGSLDSLASHFMKNYESYANEFPEYEIPWEASVLGEITYRDLQLISIRFSSEVFVGGAHGYASTSFLNLNPETGKGYSTKQLFTPSFKNFVEAKFRKKYDIPPGENINNTGMFFENDQFHLPANIGFTKEGLVLHYNAYEIAAYAEGDFIMDFSFSEIEKFLKVKITQNPEVPQS